MEIKKQYLIHISLTVATFIVVLLCFFYIYLPSTTNHGEVILVPDLVGNNYQTADQLLKDKNLSIKVFDSVYAEGKSPGTILNQTPIAGTEVKSGRIIYISVVASDVPQVKMPQLISYSIKQAEMILKSYGLKLGLISYQPNINENAVLKQTIGTKDIESGTMIAKGTVIDVVVGKGLTDSTITIPNLIGLTKEEAKNTLQSFGLEIGSVVFDDSNIDQDGLIFKQKPDFVDSDSTNTIHVGSVIDVWIGGKDQDVK